MVLVFSTRHEFFLPVDGWLMFDGLQYICLFDVTSNAWKLLSVEMQNDYGDYSEIRDSRVQPVTRFSMQHTILSLMCRRFSAYFRFFLRAARHPADSDRTSNRGCPGAGLGISDTMASVPLWASTALQSAVSL